MIVSDRTTIINMRTMMAIKVTLVHFSRFWVFESLDFLLNKNPTVRGLPKERIVRDCGDRCNVAPRWT